MMPGIRERDNDNKIKNRGKRKSGKSAPQAPRRVMTAKLKKELAQRKRNGAVSEAPRNIDSTAASITEATEQVEYTTEAAVQEAGQQTRRGISKVMTKAKKERRQNRGGQKRPKRQSDLPETSVPTRPKATDSQTPTLVHIEPDAPKTPSPVHPRTPVPKPAAKELPKVYAPEAPSSKSPALPVPDTPVPGTPVPDTPVPIRLGPDISETIRPAAAVRPLPQVPSLEKDTIVTPASPIAPKEKLVDISIKPIRPKTRPASTPEHLAVPVECKAGLIPKRPSAFKGRKIPEQEHVPEAQPLLQVHKTGAPAAPPTQLVRTEDPSVPSIPPVPTPGERMRQRAMEGRKEQARYLERKFDLPDTREQPVPVHYGKSTVTPNSSAVPKENFSSGNPSIHQSIKERPRRSFLLKEKSKGGTIPPKVRQQAAKAAKVTTVPPKSCGLLEKKAAPTQMVGRAHRRARREAQRNMLQGTKKAAQRAVDVSKKVAIAAAKAGKALISTLSALVGGSALIAALCVIFLVAAVTASPFGILFSNEPSPGAVPLNAAVSQINMELTDKLALLQAGDYDSIDIQGAGPDWREVAAVFACETSMGVDGIDVVVLTLDRVARLKAVFWDMCIITSSVETIDHPTTEDTEAWTEKNLHITITARTADDMRTAYTFSGEQNSALTELLSELGALDGLLGSLDISQEDAIDILQQLPEGLPPERRAVVETACKLVGKVNYFWGGKSHVIGWDSHWGTLQKVTAAGSPSTGTYRPFGLDCSGFIDWVLRNCGLPSDGNWYIGTNLTRASQTEAMPGDFALYPGASHIGIVVGRNEAGKLLVCHCSSGRNNVVVTEFTASGFTVVGRPDIF